VISDESFVLNTHMRNSLPILLYVSRSKSGKNVGSSPATLRGTKGADFESEGRINRGSDGLGCGCSGVRKEDKDRYILVKGPFCFVFTNEDSSSPKYAIGLQNMRAEVKHAGAGSRGHVLLETNLGDMEYELSFATEAIAREFASTVQEQCAAATSEIVRKRLGHEHMLTKRSSVRYAESVAVKKFADQPDAPVSAQEIMSNLPSTPML
jgi:hypothetical protein